jgi:hypothetical protein
VVAVATMAEGGDGQNATTSSTPSSSATLFMIKFGKAEKIGLSEFGSSQNKNMKKAKLKDLKI